MIREKAAIAPVSIAVYLVWLHLLPKDSEMRVDD